MFDANAPLLNLATRIMHLYDSINPLEMEDINFKGKKKIRSLGVLFLEFWSVVKNNAP